MLRGTAHSASVIRAAPGCSRLLAPGSSQRRYFALANWQVSNWNTYLDDLRCTYIVLVFSAPERGLFLACPSQSMAAVLPCRHSFALVFDSQRMSISQVTGDMLRDSWIFQHRQVHQNQKKKVVRNIDNQEFSRWCCSPSPYFNTNPDYVVYRSRQVLSSAVCVQDSPYVHH